MNAAQHPTNEQLSAFSLGDLDAAACQVIESHVEQCGQCSDTLLSLSANGDTFVQLLKQVGDAAVEATIASNAGDSGSAAAPSIPAELVSHPRYRVIELLGRGGMGDVYKAEHTMMSRTVALKVINKRLISNSSAIDRFHREVRAAARLTHPNIVTAFDAEQAGDLHFLAMEYVDGVDLAEIVNRRGPLPVEQACDYVRQTALGLQHAHQCGMVHRDIKPQNLMAMKLPIEEAESRETKSAIGIRQSQIIKILDFGLASFANDTAADEIAHSGNVVSEAAVLNQLTALGTMMGTPDYISPEQSEDARSADIRADIYSLGCTFYFLLTGRPPFEGDNLVQKLESHRRREAHRIENIRADIPAEVAQVVRRMMAKDPAERFQTPAEVADALASFVDRHRSAAAKPVKPAARGSDNVEPPHRPRRVSKRMWHKLAACVIAALLVSILFGVVIHIATDNGQLVIETADPGVQVMIKQDGKQIQIIDTHNDKRVSTKLKTGDYEIEFLGGDNTLEISTDRIRIRRGETVLVKISHDADASTDKNAALTPDAKLSVPVDPTILPLVTRDYLAAVVLHPEKIVNRPLAESSKLALSNWFKNDVGLDMHNVEQLIVLIPASTPDAPRRKVAIPLAMIIRLQPLALAGTTVEAMIPRILNRPETRTDNDSLYHVDRHGNAAYVVDERTIVQAPEELLARMIASDNLESPLAQQLRQTDLDHDIVGVMPVGETARGLLLMSAAYLREQLSGDLVNEAASIPEAIRSVTWSVSFGVGDSLALSIQATDEKAAEMLERLARAALEETRWALIRLGAVPVPANNADPGVLAMRTGLKLVQATTIARRGDHVVLTSKPPAGLVDTFLTNGVLHTQQAATRSKRMNQLKQVGLAMHSYYDTYRSLPPAQNLPAEQFDKDEKPLLSWRVHILPFLGDNSVLLYKRFRLDEPWDSAHNIKLLDEMPEVFQTTGAPGTTTIQAVVGPGAIYEGQRGVQFRDVIDGTSNTILAVIGGADTAVPWTRPQDLPFHRDDPITEFGEIAGDTVLALFSDGSVKAIRKDLHPDSLRALITRAGGETIDWERQRPPATESPDSPPKTSGYFDACRNLVQNPPNIDPRIEPPTLLWAVNDAQLQRSDGAQIQWSANLMLDGSAATVDEFMTKLREKIKPEDHQAAAQQSASPGAPALADQISIRYIAGDRRGSVEVRVRSRTARANRVSVNVRVEISEEPLNNSTTNSP